MSPSLSGDDVMRNAAKTSNEKLDNFDYLTNFDDDNETAKNKLYKVGQYEMEHNWILHEGLQKNLENFDKEGKKLQISIPDNKGLYHSPVQCVVATKTSSLLYHLALLISSFPIMLF
jgi:hypothetical protein